MPILALDLGGTKLSSSLFDEQGKIISRKSTLLDGRHGGAVGELMVETVHDYQKINGLIHAIGVAIPGISNAKTQRVWAPNIPGWDDYPLHEQLTHASGVRVIVDNDRACSILGECWQGHSKNCKDAIFLAVGTGIGAGILSGGNIVRGAHDIAGAIGWMALNRPYQNKYKPMGCFEYYASGDGIARLAKEILQSEKNYTGQLQKEVTAHKIFSAYDDGDVVAKKVMRECITFWGMAAANLVSLFNPEKIIFGGGVFGPATPFIPKIKDEALLWAQPISIKQVDFEPSALGSDAALYGAGYLAMNLKTIGHE
jgi:glucokinase